MEVVIIVTGLWLVVWPPAFIFFTRRMNTGRSTRQGGKLKG